jgi:3-methyladenine DNA glycosylase/8-oxoguanine DNA glycosylase
MQLEKVGVRAIRPTAPFAFDATFHKPDHFPSGDNAWEPGIRWQTWNWQGQPLGLKFVCHGTTEEPAIQVEVYAQQALADTLIETLLDEVHYRYNLESDVSPFYAAFADDPVLGPIISRWRGMRPGHQGSLYEYVIIGIVLQNATVRRSIQMLQALLEHYGKPLEFDSKTLWCFWEPGGLQHATEADLRALKVGYRARSIKKIDDQFAQGTIDEGALRGKDRQMQRNVLLQLYGVGPATVGYLLFDVFHQWDVFDHISPWEQKIYSKLFFDVDPEHPVSVQQLLNHFARYGAYQQLAVHYIWEDLWWRRKHEGVPWLEPLIRA